MIGNDIVDLQLAYSQSNWRRKGWLQKIFTIEEQGYINNTENPDVQVWKFWSMKEAAYKAHQRRFLLSPRYNPLSYECSSGGKVSIHNYVYAVNTEFSNTYVHTIAKAYDCDYSSKIFENTTNIKQELKWIIARKLGIPLTSISIKKDENRIPILYIENKKENIDISITHHGRYSALLANC